MNALRDTLIALIFASMLALMALKINFTHTHQPNDNTDYISFRRFPLVDYFLTNKEFNWNILQLDKLCLNTFLEEILKWDGGIYKTKTGEFKRYQSSKRNTAASYGYC